MKHIKQAAFKSIAFLALFTLICGVFYTGVITVFAQAAFSDKANGSIISIDGKKYGSYLLAQQFNDQKHMWGRIMIIDTETFKDSEGRPLMYAKPSNLSPASEEFQSIVAQRVEMIKKSHPQMSESKIPVELVTVSASGLDPHISLLAAQYQVKRLSQSTGITEADINAIIDKCTSGKFLGIFGEKTVNVLKVNLMLDGILK